MRDDTSDPRETRDPDHIWLRQSVTFAVNGQTRTLEMALPLRPGATPEEVDALLDEADAGMRRLSQRLDAHLGEIIGAPAAVAAHVAPAAPKPEAAAEAAAAPRRSAALPPATSTSAPVVPPAPQPAIADRPAPRPATPAAAAAPAPSARPAAPAAAPAAVSAAAVSGGPDLTRAEFLTAAGALGLDARTVMERLNVRSLNGLNLREALDLLRRQLVREGAAEVAEAAPPSAAAAEPAPATTEDMPAPIGSSRFDEEEDSPEFELSYPDPEELPSEDEYAGEDDFSPFEAMPEPASEPAPAAPSEAAPARAASAAALSGPLSDVPDLEELLGSPAAPAASAPPEEEAADPETARARELIGKLRAAHAGGQPTEHQRKAYHNIVVAELGETKAASVARAVWNLTADKLGPEQLDELIRWGKQDTFAEEVEGVLALLRAEWLAQQQAAKSGVQAPAPAAPAPQAEQPAERPAPRGRPAASRASGASGANSGASGNAPRGGARQRGGA